MTIYLIARYEPCGMTVVIVWRRSLRIPIRQPARQPVALALRTF